MKFAFLFSGFLSVLFLSCKDEEIVFDNECYPLNLRSGVIAAYSFSQGSLINETSADGDLININQALPSADRAGNPQCAYAFTNVQGNQYLYTPSTSFLNQLDQFSISLWYQAADTTREGGDYEVLMGRNCIQGGSHCPDRRGEWSLGLFDCRKAVFGHDNSVWMNDPVPQPFSCQEIVNTLTGNWAHIVATYDHHVYKIYYNGVLQESESGIAGCQQHHAAQDIGDLFVGLNYKGSIDDILIYNRALADSEVAELFTLQPCCKP